MNTFKNEMNVRLEPELKKCPICQGMAEIKKTFVTSSSGAYINSMWVQCLSCGLQTEKIYYASGSSVKHRMEEAAIKTWNERQKEDITEEKAIDKLHETGWLQKHDEYLSKAESTMSHPEIVHCKDCIHRPLEGEALHGRDVEFPEDDDYICPFNCPDPFYNRRPPSYGYCIYGEETGK